MSGKDFHALAKRVRDVVKGLGAPRADTLAATAYMIGWEAGGQPGDVPVEALLMHLETIVREGFEGARERRAHPLPHLEGCICPVCVEGKVRSVTAPKPRGERPSDKARAGGHGLRPVKRSRGIIGQVAGSLTTDEMTETGEKERAALRLADATVRWLAARLRKSKVTRKATAMAIDAMMSGEHQGSPEESRRVHDEHEAAHREWLDATEAYVRASPESVPAYQPIALTDDQRETIKSMDWLSQATQGAMRL